MEGDVVVFAGPREILHPLAVLRRDVGQKLDHDGAVLQFDDDGVLGVPDIGHCGLLGQSFAEPSAAGRVLEGQSVRVG